MSTIVSICVFMGLLAATLSRIYPTLLNTRFLEQKKAVEERRRKEPRVVIDIVRPDDVD